MKFREALKKVLTKDELGICPTSYDVVGDIAIIDVPQELEQKEKQIAITLLELLKHIKVVVKKVGIHTGTYRLQKYTILAGERRKTTIHKESGVRLKLHIEQTYFSMRSGHERLRIAHLVKKGERILVMFSGIAPFPLVIAKNAHPSFIVAIEMNPRAHEFAVENIRLNKCTKLINAINGDVRSVIPRLRQTFDRIIMPLPKGAELFLKDALKVSHRGTIFHLYQFGREDEIEGMKRTIRHICKEHGRSIRFRRVVKAGHYSPYVYRLCFDFSVTNQ